MPPHAHTLRSLGRAALLILLAAAWALFAPLQVGGQAAYVIVSGISMEPAFHRGDLVILRQAEDYGVGDVVTYRHPTIGPVIHRIVERDGDRYVFKGDNNGWIDEYRPRQDELIGRLWFHLPGVGRIVERLRAPAGLAALTAIFGAILMTTGRSSTVSPGRPRQPLLNIRLVFGAAQPRLQAPAQKSIRAHVPAEDLLFAIATLALAALVLGAFAFTRPATRVASEDLGYDQAATLAYSASAPASVYDGGDVRSGQPIFRQLTSRVDLHVAYRFVASQTAELAGTCRLVAEVGDGDGWSRQLELKPATRFQGTTIDFDATLDLDQVQRLLDTFEQQTGAQRGQYTLAIVPMVAVSGMLDGLALSDDFAPRLEFQLDKQQLRVARQEAAGQDPFHPVKKGLLKRDLTVPSTLNIFGIKLEVLAARRIALIGLAVALAAGLLLGSRTIGARRADPLAHIRRAYGQIMVEARGETFHAGAPTVEVATIADLARVAARGGHMILHYPHGAAHDYLVCDGGVIYLYRLMLSPEPAPPLSQER